MRPKRRHKRWLILAGAIIALLGVLWFLLPLIVAPILRAKLQAGVLEHLDADLELSRLSYSFPYTIRVTDARVKARGAKPDDANLLHIRSAELTLAKLPFGGGPLLIRNIDFDEPMLRLVRAPRPAVAATRPGSPAPAQPQPTAQLKLSELFWLRRLTLRGGKLVFEDHTRPDTAPMVWDHLDTDLHINPESASLYGFRVTTQAPPLAEISAEGTIDIDQLVIAVDRVALSGRVDPEASASALPPVLSRFIQEYRVRAGMTLEGPARVPLRDLAASSFQATIRLIDGQARLPRSDGELTRINASLLVDKPAGHSGLAIRIEQLDASAERDQIRVDRADGAVDFAQRTWRLSIPRGQVVLAADAPTTAPAMDASVRGGSIELSASFAGPLEATWSWGECDGLATFHDVSLQTRPFEAPLSLINGTVRLDDGALLAQALTAKYGDDAWSLARARVPLGDGSRRLKVFDMSGEVRFAPPSPAYPAALGRVIAQLRPAGAFKVRGAFSVDLDSYHHEWDVLVRSDAGAFDIADPPIALSSVRGAASITPEGIELRDITAGVFGGSLAGSGTIDPRGSIAYAGQLSLEDIDLSKVGGMLQDSNIRLVGRAEAVATFSAAAATRDALRGEGELSIRDGEIWEAPVLVSVAEQSKIRRETLTASEASASFAFADGRVDLRRAAVYSPALGLQGTGTIGFDGALNLRVVAAPLGNWEEHIKKTNIPLMSKVVGTVAGAMQQAVNAATSELLYEFHVTGTTSAPSVQPVPAPVLTDGAAMIFERMLQRDDSLFRRPSRKPAPPPEP